MQVLVYLVEEFVLPNLKAWVGLGVLLANGFLADKGITVDEEGINALALGVSSVVSAFLVWLVPNRGA